MIEREPPANLRAEASLLGSILCDNRALDQCIGLSADAFFDPLNGAIFDACKRRIEMGREVDPVILSNAMIADPGYLVGLASQMVSTRYVSEYANAIRDCALRRREIDIAKALTEGAYTAEGSASLTAAMRALEEAGAAHGLGGATSMADAVEAALTQSDAAYRGDARARGLNTGITSLDQALGGLHDGSLNIIGARSGEGKSSMALQIARHVATEGSGMTPVAIFSMEMSSEDIGLVNLASTTGISADNIRLGRYDLHMANDLLEARVKLFHLPIHIVDTPALPLGEAITILRSLKRRHGIRLAIFDHRDLFGRDPGHERDVEVPWYRHVTATLKAAAKTVGIPFILLVQLNRDIERREDKRPRKSDLYGAGEQDADNIILLYRPELHMGDGPRRGPESEAIYADRLSRWEQERENCRGRCDAFLVKRRFGPPGMVSLRFDGPSLTFL